MTPVPRPTEAEIAASCQRTLRNAAKPLPLAELRAVCADFGYSSFRLDRANAIRAERIVALGKARQYRQDYFSLARAVRILGSWEAHETGAGSWGDLYVDRNIPEARDLARECWREALWDMNVRIFGDGRAM